ncbi:MAG: hypothetical protein A2Z15_04870 [Chloroflexi bacterium RBG_16_50_11]|nr:MAG: hypothetical protein A2Z15_04870 [Chloroflexi bacterium RBG_16_50_11]
MKRKWWLWTLLPVICIIIVITVSELTNVSEGQIFLWSASGILGTVAIIVMLILLALFTAFVAMLIKKLLGILISNKDNLANVLLILGFFAILVGYILAIKFGWSIFILMVGFYLGHYAGREYNKTNDNPVKQ